MAQAAGQASESIFDGIVGVYKKALAANRAKDINEKAKEVADAKEGKMHGMVYHAVDEVTDKLGDTANFLTAGAWYRCTNIFRGKDVKIDYKSYKDAKKMGEIDSTTKVADRAQYMFNDKVAGASTPAISGKSSRASQAEALAGNAMSAIEEKVADAELDE